LASGLVEQLEQGGVAGEVDGEGLQGPLQGGVGVVADGGDVAAVEVAQDHGLDQVVDVADGEGQVDARRALDGALALEEADAAGEQHHLGDGQGHAGLGAGLVTLGGGAGGGAVGQGEQGQQGRGQGQAQGGQQPRTAHDSSPSQDKRGDEQIVSIGE